MMKRAAVLGGTGMAGHVAVTYLTEQGYDVYYTSLSARDSHNSKALNAGDIPALRRWLTDVKPDVILNCAGILIKEAEVNPERAILINAYLPRFLERIYTDTPVKIIHLSTDCVFSGKRGGYLESDIPDGDTVYDRTKLLGEIVNKKDLTFRMSIIGPDCKPAGVGLFNWFMRQKGNVKGYIKAFWNGITTVELARAVEAAINQDLTGLYHLVTPEPINKYSLLCLFKQIFNKTNICIEPFDGYSADKTLVNTRRDFDFKVHDYERQVKDMKTWVEKHKNLYSYDLR